MTEREKELTAALELLVQKGGQMYDTICGLEESETAHKANWDCDVGSEPWLRSVHAMIEARQAVKHDKIILAAAVREARDVLYTETINERAA